VTRLLPGIVGLMVDDQLAALTSKHVEVKSLS